VCVCEREREIPVTMSVVAGKRKRERERERERETLVSSISEGETGGLSVKEPLRGPLLCESLPEVRGDTSCCKDRDGGVLVFD
jgi:hypothetical protein